VTQKKKAAKKGTHGGRRPGAGKRTYFPGKEPQPHAVLLTARGRQILDRKRAELKGASRSDIFEALLRLHGEGLTMDDVAAAAG